MRRRGIGERLLRRLLLVAGNRQIAVVRMVCLPHNVAMQRLAKRFGGRIHFDADEVTGVADVRPPTPFSITREAWLEGPPRVEALIAQWSLFGR